MNLEALNSLPENGVSADILTVDTDATVFSDENAKHLLKFAENIKGVYRFASHPRFSYWAFKKENTSTDRDVFKAEPW